MARRAYPIPRAFASELKLWRAHFEAEGDSPERANEHARAVVTGVYLRDEEPATLVDDSDELPRAGFVARPVEGALPRLELPPFRWGDVVPLPPEGPLAAAATGPRALDGEPHANSPTDVGGVQSGWRAA